MVYTFFNDAKLVYTFITVGFEELYNYIKVIRYCCPIVYIYVIGAQYESDAVH